MKELRSELIKYALWYDRCTMPEDCQTPERDLIQNVDSYIALHPDIEEAMQPETTEPKDKDEMYLNMQYYMEYCERNGYVTPQDWVEKYKHW